MKCPSCAPDLTRARLDSHLDFLRIMLSTLVALSGLVLNPVAPVSHAVASRSAAPVMAAADGFVPDMQVRPIHHHAIHMI